MPSWEAAAKAIGQMPQEILKLGALPLLKDLDPDALERISAIARRNTYRADQIIVLDGESCSTVHLILSGFVRVRQLSLEGREHVLAYLGPGRAFGVVSALDGGAHLATIDALSDTTTLGIPCEAFAEFARENPALLAAIADELAAEVRRLTGMLKDMALHTVRARLARFLLTHAENHPPHRRCTRGIRARDGREHAADQHGC